MSGEHALPYGLEEYGVSFRRIPTNGITLNVAEAGDGPPVFLLHGFPECWATWGPQIKHLVDHGYTAVAPEMRGHGESDAPSAVEAYDTVELAADVVGLFDAYDQDEGVVIGHDWGAIVAWHTAWLHPDRVKGVGGMSVPWFGRGDTDILTALREQMEGRYFYIIDFQRDEVVEALNEDIDGALRAMLTGESDAFGTDDPNADFLDTLTVPEEAPEFMPEDFLTYIATRYEINGFGPAINWYRNYRRTWEHTEGKDPTITVPAMYLMGSEDWTNIYAQRIGLDMDEQCSDLRVSETVEAGHWLGQEKPDWTNRHILAFLESVGHHGEK
ncbi:alpha/beta fold hydrolase [Haloarchaeobius sp. HRN-SO-5]|uniref:alpha/beta fold hydrolase n=1 Tax=Haloarchaeobius sp. HRN-SO-5 TaxID=3446118 RepID=UPI003EBB5C0A